MCAKGGGGVSRYQADTEMANSDKERDIVTETERHMDRERESIKRMSDTKKVR